MVLKSTGLLCENFSEFFSEEAAIKNLSERYARLKEGLNNRAKPSLPLRGPG